MKEKVQNNLEDIEILLEEAQCDFTTNDSSKSPTKVKRRLIGFVGGQTDEPIVKSTKQKIGFDDDIFKR